MVYRKTIKRVKPALGPNKLDSEFFVKMAERIAQDIENQIIYGNGIPLPIISKPIYAIPRAGEIFVTTDSEIEQLLREKKDG